MSLSPTLNFDVAGIGGKPWQLGLLAGPIFATRRQHRYFYGVSESDARPDRPAFDAHGGYAGLQFLVSLSRRFEKAWFGAYARYDTLRGAVFEDSPLVRRPYYLSTGFAIAWIPVSILQEDRARRLARCPSDRANGGTGGHSPPVAGTSRGIRRVPSVRDPPVRRHPHGAAPAARLSPRLRRRAVPAPHRLLPADRRQRGTGEKGVALTFDDGPDPEVTPLLLDLLDRHSIPATFFVTGERAARHPSILRDILSRGHAIGNHSYHHFPFLMLKGIRTLRREIESTQSCLAGFGIVPLAFRPPAGITNPLLRRVLLEQGMYCVDYSCRAVDIGNRRIGRIEETVLKAVSPGDIIALHDVAPRHDKPGAPHGRIRRPAPRIEGEGPEGGPPRPTDRQRGHAAGGITRKAAPGGAFLRRIGGRLRQGAVLFPRLDRPQDRIRALRSAAPVALFPVGPGARNRRRHRHFHPGDRPTLPGR